MRRILLCLVLIFTVGALHAQTFTGSTGSSIGAIPDSGVVKGATCFPLTVTGVGKIDSTYGLASVTINITHSYDADLIIKLKAPDGTTVVLSNQNGSSGNNYTGTVFTSTAALGINAGTPPFKGKYLPEGGNLGAVNNKQNGDGIWSLCIEDVNPSNVGTVDSWSLTFNNTPALAPPPIPACSSNATAINTCVDAPFVCNLDGFCGSTSSSFVPYEWTELTNAFLGCKNSSIQNNSFIKFVASATSASFDVWVYNSLNGDGIQMLFFNDVCSAGKVTSYGCSHQIPIQSTPFLITAKGLTIGKTYYLMFDGFGGDVCDYTIKAVSGVNVVNIALQPDSSTVCRGTQVNLKASGGGGTTYSWNTSTNPSTANPNSALSSTTITNPILNTSLLSSTVTYDTITLTGTAVGACPATSTSVIHLVDVPSVTSSASTQSGLAGFIATPLTTTSTTTGVTYQWYLSSSNTYTGAAVAGAITTSYTPPTSAAGTFYYYCIVSNGGCVTPGNINTVVVNPVPTCAADTLAFVQQPTNVAQGTSMSPAVKVKVFCKANGINPISTYTGLVTIMVKDGCGFKSISYNIKASDNGIATFDTIKFSRSVQNGVSLVATANGISGSVTSDTFSITTPTGGGGGSTVVTKTIASNDFENPLTGKWSWTAGAGTVPAEDVTGIDCQAGNCYLRKSDKGQNAAGKNEDLNTIIFSNLTNLSKYTNLILSFKVASLSDVGCATAPATGSCKSADSGPGTDGNEDMLVETSVDGGVTWQTLLTHKGSGNRLFPFANSPLTTLSLGAGVTYATGQDNSSFKVDITGNTQFQLRVVATDNRFSENWSIDDVILTGDTTIISNPAIPSPLLTVVAGNDTAICSLGSANLYSTVTNGVGTIKYKWSPSTGLTNQTDSTLANPVATKLTANQTYQLSIVDGDNCPATANPVNIIINKKPVLNSQSTAAQTVCIGGTLTTLSVSAANTETYQWYSNTAASNSGGTIISGATTPSFMPPATTAGTTYYYCELSGVCTPKVTSSVSGAIVVSDVAAPVVSVTNPTCTTATGAVNITSTTSSLTFSTDGITYSSYTTPYILAAGTAYSITAKNSNGCISSATTGTIGSQPASITTPTVTLTNPTCTTATGSVTITSTTTGLTFSTNGSTYATYTAPFTVASGASYSITAKNSDGCVSSPVTGTIGTQPATPSIPSVSVTDPTCTTATGSIAITSSTTGLTFSIDGTTYASYTTPFVVAAGAAYSITAKNIDGCISSASTGTIIAQPATPAAPTVNAVNPTCTNAKGSVEITSTTSNLTFSTNGVTYTSYSTPYIINANGSYSITAKNTDGCISAATTGTLSAQPATPTKPTVSITKPTCTDANGSVAVSSTTSGLTFSTDGSTYGAYSTPYTVATGASYSITSKNADGCVSAAITGTMATQPPTPAIPTLTITDPTCTKATGTVAISSTTTGLTFSTNAVNYVGYSAPYTVAAGASYSITAKNIQGCISSAATGILIAQPATPAIPTVAVTSPTCTDANGYVDITSATTGLIFSTDAITYASYNTPYAVIAGGAYSITAKNSDGCISKPATGKVAKQPATPISPRVLVTNPTCTTATGAIKITSSTNSLTFSTDGATYASYTTPYVVAAGTTYSITAKNIDGCISSATTGTILAQPATPVAPTVNAVNPTCTNTKGSVEITSTTAGLTFSTNGITYTVYSTPYIVNANGSYSITAKNTDGCISPAITGKIGAQLAIPTAPKVLVTNPTCTTATGSVKITSATTGLTFSTDGTSYDVYSTPYTIAASASYSITAKNADGCTSAPATGTLIAQPATPSAPTITVTDPSCSSANGSVAITSSTTGLMFSTNGRNYANYSNPYLVAAGVSYSITAKNADGCTSLATTGTMIAQPTPPKAFSVIGGGSYCPGIDGLAIALNNSETGVYYQLQKDGVNTGSLISGTGTALSFPKQSAIGTYTVAATYASSGCTSNMKGSAAIVNGVPKVLSVTITPSTTTPCLGTLVSVSAKPTNAGKDAAYEWKINDSIVQTGTLISFTTKALKDKDTISCLLTSHIGCLVSDSGYSSKIAFTVSTIPTIDSIKSTTNDTVCQNANITLTNKTSNGVWTSDKSYIATVDIATGVVTGVVGGIDSIKYTVSNKCGSVATKFGVHVINLSKLAPIEGDSIICKGSDTRLYNSISGGVWAVDNRLIDTVASNGKVAGLQLGNDSVSYTYAGYCNTVTTKHGIKVIGKPLDSKDITIYPPKCLSPFSASLDLNITGTESPYTYTFNGNTFPVTTSVSGIGEGIYYLYIYNYAGCLIDSFPHVQFSSEGCDSLYVPTGFIPGSITGSGRNNLLKPFGGSITTVTSLTFRVYNRYGNQLFVSRDLISGWDGSFKGIAQEPGTYVWYLDYTLAKGDKKISLKGTSVLIR